MNNADIFFEKLDSWRPELEQLRKIILGCPLEEELKWGSPVYTFESRNIIGMRGFKEHFAVWFYNGVFLGDPHHLLISAGDKTKSLRQLRMTSMEQLQVIEKILVQYIWEAIEVEKSGLKILPDKNQLLELPIELKQCLEADPLLASAFNQLTPGRQKEYANYISEAKQPATREKRLEKCLPLIAQCIGLNDRYRNC